MREKLQTLEAALREPFPCESIKFKPTQPQQHSQTRRWECLALPYADKRVYEDRLNLLAYGEWSTPYASPTVAGNKLVIPVTVILLGVAHTDYGEAFLTSTTRQGETREEENCATEAYSQAFRRACSHFGLGRYLYQLPKLWLAYDPHVSAITTPPAERIAWVEKLYREAGLSAHLDISQKPMVSTTPSSLFIHPLDGSNNLSTPSVKANRVDEKLLNYLRAVLTDQQTQRACTYYQVADLVDLTPSQALHLSDFIQKKATTETPV